MLREPSSGCSANQEKKLGELTSFLTERTFTSRTGFEWFDEAVFGVQNASLDMLWEYSPSSANLASDWLRAKRALLWMRMKGLEIERKVDDDADTSLASESSDLFLSCGRRRLVSGTQNDIVFS